MTKFKPEKDKDLGNILKISKIIFILVLFFNCGNCFAWDSIKNHNISEQDLLIKNRSDLNLIENYLNNIKFLQADFIQQSSDGSIINGKFWLSRPGKMRVEYKKPSPILIVVNGNVLSYSDLELEETSYLNTNSTPASFLTRENFSFEAKDIELASFSKSTDSMIVSLVKKNKKEAGQFTLVFNIKPIKFIRMEVKNDLDEIVKVTFLNSKFDEKISGNLFIIKNKNLPE